MSSSPDSTSHGNPANRLGLDYRQPPPRKIDGPIVDIHTHITDSPHTPLLFEAADLYGIHGIVSMTPLPQLDAIARDYGDRVGFVAIPDWKGMKKLDEPFRERWIGDLRAFRARGARICKFWMAPPMRQRHGLTIDHAFLRPVVEAALELEYDFMIHVADPSAWFRPGGKYEDAKVFGTKQEQYEQLEWFLDRVAPRTVIGAHMAGSIENLVFLQALLDRHANLVLDSSATKWIVREVAWQPKEVRAFLITNAARVLFGSDLVAAEKYDTFEHYASRYWVHQKMWETAYRGESPIEDPDGSPPKLAGVDLPPEVLVKLYRENAARLGLVP